MTKHEADLPLDVGDNYLMTDPATKLALEAGIAQALRSGWVSRLSQDDILDKSKCRVICSIFPLMKTDLSPRMVYNAIPANYFFRKGRYVMPALGDPLRNAFEFAAKLDLASSFMHLPMHEELSAYMCFRGPDGSLY